MPGGVPGKPLKQNSYKGPQPMRNISLLATPWCPQADPQGTGLDVGSPQRGCIDWALLQNTSAGDLYVKIFDTQNAPQLSGAGATTPTMTVYVPKGSSTTIYKTYFANGIWMIGCSTVADGTNTAPTANQLVVNGTFTNP